MKQVKQLTGLMTNWQQEDIIIINVLNINICIIIRHTNLAFYWDGTRLDYSRLPDKFSLNS